MIWLSSSSGSSSSSYCGSSSNFRVYSPVVTVSFR